MDFATSLLIWYQRNARPLPWRETKDAYAIWLSEVILQQTRVEQGEGYWHRFMRLFPTVEALASATEDEVLRAWQGLGYYSRARNLHAAARQVVSQGAFPRTIEGLRSLRGVGEYTAAAIGSIAFGLPAAAVDGNVFRVLARYFGLASSPYTTQGRREFTTLATELLPSAEPGNFNQALMDFGAMVCTPQKPRCELCPFALTCVALREERMEELPVKRLKKKVTERRLTYIYIRNKGRVAMHRREEGDIWQGLWEPLLIEGQDKYKLQTVGREGVVAFVYSAPTDSPEEAVLAYPQLLVRNQRHELTHRILMADFYFTELQQPLALPDGYCWVDEGKIDEYALPRLIVKLLERLPAPCLQSP
ncbi:MAG: A/G-specific adenine glycosylase [Bacteroidales bacterium]|nr:A/G-specific adenine glycosylase [Bacteroidales bacterium]